MTTIAKLLVITKKGKDIKKIKVRMGDGRAEIKIPTNLKRNGKRVMIKKKYKATKEKIVAFMCVEAVIKYWSKYDPQIHDMYWTQDYERK